MEIASKFKDMENVDIEAYEKKIGSAAARALTLSFRNQIKKNFDRRSGAMDKTNVRARYKSGNLDRLVINSPHYSFKQHYGSVKKGVTPSFSRKGSDVRSFARHLENSPVNQQVKAYHRSGGTVSAHIKGIDYKAVNHIAKALKETNALQLLATELTSNRAVKILSSFDW